MLENFGLKIETFFKKRNGSLVILYNYVIFFTFNIYNFIFTLEKETFERLCNFSQLILLYLLFLILIFNFNFWYFILYFV
jgi:hypothetical protein